MRLATFGADGAPSYGLVTDSGLVDLGRRMGRRFPDLRSLLDGGLDEARDRLGDDADYALDAVRWAPVIPNPGQLLCVGLNYRQHVEEVGRPPGRFPTIFLRVAQSQMGHLEPLVRPAVSEMLDYEGELAVIIGRRARHVAVAEAAACVAGYAPYNDASVRDWQRHSAQYTPGKNFPATGGFGPWLVTADEVEDPAALTVSTRVNGEELQRACVDELIFTIPELISYISTFTELRPGDVVVTGTPSGVGSMREPPRWLHPGDVVEVEVSGIGTLCNRVDQEPPASAP